MKKKIIVITPNFYPENFPINSFVEILAKDNDVEVLTNIPSYRKNRFYEGYGFFGPYKDKFKDIKVFRIPTFPRLSDKKIFIFIHYLFYFFSMTIFSSIYFYLKRKQIKAILTYCLSPTFTGFFGIIGSKITKAKHFNWVQDIWPEAIISSTGNTNKLLIKVVKYLQNHIFKKSELITQSYKMTVFLENQYKKKIFQINNVPRKDFLEDKKININDKLTFSYFGNIGKAQKLEYFLDIFRSMNDQMFLLNIYGSGSEKKILERQYNFKNIFWHGYKKEEDLFLAYQKTNFFLLPIDSVGRQRYILPGKFSSYLSFYRPIIGFSKNDTSLQNAIEENKVGYFININNDHNTNVQKLMDIKNIQRIDYQNICKNCENYYRSSYSPEAIRKQANKIFNTKK